MQKVLFSILVVSLNPGNKLLQTIKSILEQTYHEYEVLIKDGGSSDDSLPVLREYLNELEEEQKKRIRIVEEKDASIYDGMNQATRYAKGEFLYFLNCGDVFYENDALEQVAKVIYADKQNAESETASIYYGNIYDALRKQVVQSNPQIDAFACYRNVPCHQACIYHTGLFQERGYKTNYKVRGDYEHFLWCYFEKKVNIKYVDVVLASYEGGGFSETAENRKRSKQEHSEITAIYMKPKQVFQYRLILLLTLAPLRTKMAESRLFAGIYQTCKRVLYNR